MNELELKLLRSGEIPTDEDIDLYYKMYLKKWHLDHEDEWTTYENKPMSFEDWEKRAKMCSDTTGGYNFIVSHTMDTFIGGLGGAMVMMRHRDYRAMVEEEEKMIKEQESIDEVS